MYTEQPRLQYLTQASLAQDRLSSGEFDEAKSFFAATKEFSDNATKATKSVIDTILVADFFFIILVLLWLILGE